MQGAPRIMKNMIADLVRRYTMKLRRKLSYNTIPIYEEVVPMISITFAEVLLCT